MGRGKFLRSLKQRWWLLFLIVLPVTLGVLFYAVYSKVQYEGFVTLGDRKPGDQNQTVIYPGQEGTTLNDAEMRAVSLANTIGSYTVLRSTYDEIKAQNLIRVEGGKDEAAIREFASKVNITPLRGSEFIRVSYISESANTAKTIIEILNEKFRARFSTMNSEVNNDTLKFIGDQLKEAKTYYSGKLQEQKEFMDENPDAAAFAVRTEGLVSRINQVRDRLAASKQQYASAREILRNAEENRNNPENAVVAATSTFPNPVYTSTEQQLSRDKAQLDGLMQRYGESHPVILDAKKRIQTQEEFLKALEASGQKTSIQTNGEGKSPTETDRIRTEFNAKGSMDAAVAEQAGLNEEMAGLNESLAKLPVVQKALAEMSVELSARAETVERLTLKESEAKTRLEQTVNKTVTQLDPPGVQEVDKRTVLKTLIAFFLSLVVAVSIIATLGQFDVSTYTPSEAENSLGFPVLVALPRSSQQRLNPEVEQVTPLSAAYQILSTQLMSLKSRLVGPGILVASAEPRAGKTTVAANLAISLARDGARVLLVDADLRSPKLHSHFGLQNRVGLSEVLGGGASIEDVVQPTGVEGLLFIGAGDTPVNPVRLFRGEVMKQFIEQIGKGADFIVIDSPTGSAFGDAGVLAEHVQNIVLVHEAGTGATEAEHEFHKALERQGVNVLGMVLNMTRVEDSPAYLAFKRNYESTLSRHSGAARTALGPGTEAQKPQQYGSKKDDGSE